MTGVQTCALSICSPPETLLLVFPSSAAAAAYLCPNLATSSARLPSFRHTPRPSSPLPTRSSALCRRPPSRPLTGHRDGELDLRRHASSSPSSSAVCLHIGYRDKDLAGSRIIGQRQAVEVQQRSTMVDQISASWGWTPRPSRAEKREAGTAAGRGLENRWPVVRDMGVRDLRELEARWHP